MHRDWPTWSSKEKEAREGSVPGTTGSDPTEGLQAFPGEPSKDQNGDHCFGKSSDTDTAEEQRQGLASFVIRVNDCSPDYCTLGKIYQPGVNGIPPTAGNGQFHPWKMENNKCISGF